MSIKVTISPAIQDYRFFHKKQWEEKSSTRFIKTWEENYIPPKKTPIHKAKEDKESKVIDWYLTNQKDERIENAELEDYVYLNIRTKSFIR